MALADYTAPYMQPRAAWAITLDGVDLTLAYAPRVLSVRLSEALSESADQLDITLDDHDGQFMPPAQGSTITLSLGWDRGTPVELGLVGKGSFTVDEVSWDGPPDRVTITARSADLKGTFRLRKTRTWRDQTVGGIITQLASDNGLSARCHADLASETVALAEQHNKSDMQFVRDLGRQYDATATVKGGALIFAPRGATTAPSGTTLPTRTIARSQCSTVSWRRAARDKDQDGAEAQWHDQAAGKRKTVTAGGTNRKRLKRIYATEAEATTAAQSETARLQRASAILEATLAWGNASLTPGTPVTATGFRPHIDQQSWRITRAEHTMDAGGFKTRVEMEVAG